MKLLSFLLDKILPSGHQTFDTGEVSPNGGPIDIKM